MHPITTKALDQLLSDIAEEQVAQRLQLANETELGPQQIILGRLAALRQDEHNLNTFIEENQ
jgi:hypothetical protein